VQYKGPPSLPKREPALGLREMELLTPWDGATLDSRIAAKSSNGGATTGGATAGFW
jgi:hypothetical protein